MLRIVLACAAILSVVGSLDALAADAKSTTSLLIKTADLTPELVLAVAKIGEQKIVPAVAGGDILEIISRYCGTANVRRYYLPLFIAANADNPDIAAKQTILKTDANLTLPACLFADEKLAAVTVANEGPAWDLPTAIRTASLLPPVAADALAPTDKPRLQPHQPGSGKLAEAGPTAVGGGLGGTPPSKLARGVVIKASRMAGQTVDFSRLAKPDAVLPDSLATVGPELVTKPFDSVRLDDADLRAQYDKLADKVLVAAKASSGDFKLDREIAVRASVFERTVRTQDILASNTKIDFAKLQRNAKIVTSNFAPGSYAITVRPDIDPADAANQVRAAGRMAALTAPGSNVTVNQMGDYVPDFGQMQSDDTDSDCPVATGQSWPYDFEELKRVLDFRKRVDRPAQPGKLLVLDTGFPPEKIDTPPFSKRYFVNDGDGADLYSYVRTSVPYRYFFEKAKEGSHGVAVLTLALGGVDAMKSNAMLDLIKSDEGQIISLMGYRARDDSGIDLDVNGDSVAPTLYGSNWASTDVTGINLSLRFNAPKDEFSSYFGTNNQVVYVFSAGNSPNPVDLALKPAQPAVLGGPSVANVITVGGLTPNDEHWRRSNFSVKFVDIAAPACAVPSYVWNEASETFDVASLNGTSFAAPLVSFTANLIRGNATPGYKIKSRIIGSSRHVAALDRRVSEGRALDIPVAAAVPFDAIRMKDGSLLLGSIDWGAGKPLCGTIMKRPDLAQVQRLENDADTLALAVRQNRRIVFSPCPMQSDDLKDLSFRPVEPAGEKAQLGQAMPLDFAKVRSITLCEVCWKGP